MPEETGQVIRTQAERHQAAHVDQQQGEASVERKEQEREKGTTTFARDSPYKWWQRRPEPGRRPPAGYDW